jgi:hypothetical protein
MGRLTRRVLAVIAAGGLLLGLVPVTSAATWVEFGTPTVESSFETGVRFSQPVTIAEPAGRVELLLTVADAIGPTVIVVPDPPIAGSTTLTHSIGPGSDGQFLPNTPLVARWRLVAADDPTDVQVGPEIRVTYADDRFAWKTEAGDVVRVHWTEGSDAFGKRALRIAEDAIDETSALLGVTESEPIDFYIYADGDSFRDAIGPGIRENVGGLAVAGIRTLFALIPPSQIDDAWVGVVIPHELTHLVFDTASENAYHFPPHWLNEGVADYVSQGYTTSYRATVRDASRSGTLIPLDGLTGQFPTTAGRFLLAYAESVSAVDYLVRTYDTDALVGLIRSYADGRTDDEAFSAALGVDMTTFAAAWLDDLDAKAPTRYGPQPAPSGPVPPAWAAASPAPEAASPAPVAASPAPGVVLGTGVADVPAWLAPIVAIIGVVVVAILLVAARRNRAAAGSS